VEGHFDQAVNVPNALAPGRAVLLAHPEPRMSVAGVHSDRSQGVTAELSVHVRELSERFDQEAAVRLALQQGKSSAVDSSKGGRGGVSLALTNELAGLQALRRRVLPAGVMWGFLSTLLCRWPRARHRIPLRIMSS
jgi:hypothetical protein